MKIKTTGKRFENERENVMSIDIDDDCVIIGIDGQEFEFPIEEMDEFVSAIMELAGKKEV